MPALSYSSPLAISRTQDTARRSLFIVAPLRRGDLAVHVVEGSPTAHEHPGDGEQPIGAKAVIEPLTREEEGDDGDRELYPDAGEISAGQTLSGAGLRPLLVLK
jgi:hypothetical protein